jgi:hypothetical protein
VLSQSREQFARLRKDSGLASRPLRTLEVSVVPRRRDRKIVKRIDDASLEKIEELFSLLQEPGPVARRGGSLGGCWTDREQFHRRAQSPTLDLRNVTTALFMPHALLTSRL